MRQLSYLLKSTIIIFVCLVLFSFAASFQVKQLVGKWQIINIESREKTEKIKKKKIYIQFLPDGTLNINENKKNMVKNGNWKYDESTATLTIYRDNGSKDEMDLEIINNKKIILMSDKTTLYLKRVSSK